MTSSVHFNELYDKFEALALRLCQRGRRHYGAHGIIEYLRFNVTMDNPDDDFKICNDWEPLLARIFHKLNPKYDGFFTCRPSKFDDIKNWPKFARRLID